MELKYILEDQEVRALILQKARGNCRGPSSNPKFLNSMWNIQHPFSKDGLKHAWKGGPANTWETSHLGLWWYLEKGSKLVRTVTIMFVARKLVRHRELLEVQNKDFAPIMWQVDSFVIFLLVSIIYLLSSFSSPGRSYAPLRIAQPAEIQLVNPVSAWRCSHRENCIW